MSSAYVLGTAQLGMPYGIANASGQPGTDSAMQLVKAAWETGCRVFDTAQAYGNSEAVLGKALTRLGLIEQAKVITKLDPSGDYSNAGWLQESALASLHRIGCQRLAGLMLHRFEWLIDWDRCLKGPMLELQAKGLFTDIGVSVNSSKEAAQVLDYKEINMIQIPANAWDQELVDSGLLEQLKASGKQLFVRSLFLQGLLLLSHEQAASKLSFAHKASQEWNLFCAECDQDPWTVAIRYGLTLQAPLVLGAETQVQARNNGEAFTLQPLDRAACLELRLRLKPYLNEKILRPQYWNAI